jgi:hypothetical protein
LVIVLGIARAGDAGSSVWSVTVSASPAFTTQSGAVIRGEVVVGADDGPLR